MAASFHTPIADDSWSRCGTCGLDRPSHRVRLTRKRGWQCIDTCYTPDSDWDRDDYVVRYPPGEGTRWAASPTTRTLTEGVTSGEVYTIYTLYDRALGKSTTYDVTFSTGTDGTISFATSTSGNLPCGGILVNNNWVVYIQNGFMEFAPPWMPVADAAPWRGDGDLAVIGGFLQYTPFVPQTLS